MYLRRSLSTGSVPCLPTVASSGGWALIQSCCMAIPVGVAWGAVGVGLTWVPAVVGVAGGDVGLLQRAARVVSAFWRDNCIRAE